MAETLTAGRELDALIAEKIFGWLWRRPETIRRGSVAFATILPPDEMADGRIIVESDDAGLAECVRLTGAVPAYCTDIAAAWMVVEKMKRDGWLYSIGNLALSGGKEVESAGFFSGTAGLLDAQAETVPLAICLAALATVEVPHAR